MPYIGQKYREDMDAVIETLLKNPYLSSVGTLNYVITRIIVRFRELRLDPPSYQDLNGLIGVLECAKLELYRRMLAPYEDAKKVQNGDVYV